MKPIFFLIPLTFFFYLTSCSSTTRGADNEIPENLSDTIEVLPLPQIPINIHNPKEKGAFLLEHFWDALDFSDTVRSHNTNFMEQNFANFALFLTAAKDSTIKARGVKSRLQRAQSDSVAYILVTKLARLYLYDPESPMLDEESYLPFLQLLSNSPLLNEQSKARFAYQHEMALKNRVGTPAADFNFVTPDGSQQSLHGLETDTDLLLIFYEPDCNNCKETISRLANSKKLNDEIANLQIKVLAIYSGDNKKLWQASLDSIPSSWTVGYEQGEIDRLDSYVFPTSPTIYLLDREKRVLAKDLSVDKVIAVD